jgi:hypothetical protein
MSTVNRNIANDNLMLYIDPANINCYSGIGTNCIDLSRSKIFNMSLANGVLLNTYNGGVFTLDGTDDVIQSDATMANKIVQDMTWDVWFRRAQDMNGFNMILSCSIPYLSFRGDGGVNPDYFLFSFLTRKSFVNTQRTLYSTTTYSDNVWYNIVCTLSQNTVTQIASANMYVNGSLVNTVSHSGAVDTVYQPSSSTNLRFGRYIDSSPYPFKGDIGPVKIYTKILSENEVLQNYNVTKSRFGL